MTVHFSFDNTYARLPDRFFARVPPTSVTAPRLIRLNRDLAAQLCLDPDWPSRSTTSPRTRRTAMRAVNQAFIPRNHRVEAIIEAAVEQDDFAPFEELLKVVLKPYEDQPAFAHYADPPQAHERVHQTFCGT